MTEREKAIAALELKKPEGLIPTLELEFQLSEELIGKKTLHREDLKGVTGVEREEMLRENAKVITEVAEKLDYCIVTGIHWLPTIEDQIFTYNEIKRISGEKFLLSAFIDGTMAIPSGESMMEIAYRLHDDKEEVLKSLELRVQGAIEAGVKLIEGGAEIIFMCADYCFNAGPFLSPTMFSEFVTPFLKRETSAFRDAGAYVVKHTDGDIMPILDQIVECQPHGLHSLDPMAGVDIKEVKDLVGDKICLIGNVNCAMLQSGTRGQIEESALYCLEHGGVKRGGYIYATSNCVFEGVPLDNYFYMLELRKEFGRCS